MEIKAARVFPDLRIRRPVNLLHSGDGTNRLFVGSQQGVIHVFPNQPDVAETDIFWDMENQIAYKREQFEEGLIGMAFHPKYKTNGQFFTYYTLKQPPHVSVISRWNVSKDNPNLADMSSEEEILRIKQPYWNHNGGTLIFGPDGYLYIALGDGGSGRDPHRNGQNRDTLFGSILRIDIDKKENNLNYAIPPDNPFVGQPGAKGEIWAWGLRNVWRMAFDPQDGTLWAGDVGQDLWEEINLVTRGGNYGWNLREGAHKFGLSGSDARDDLIEPIFEYDHEVGKSITGGFVYRGKRLPELFGAYLYADFVSGKLWALQYDRAAKKVMGNRPLAGSGMPIMTFGQDEMGEAYCTDDAGRIYQFVRSSD